MRAGAAHCYPISVLYVYLLNPTLMLNKVILIGNLGKDPVVRHTEGGVPVATFSLATSENYKDKDGNRAEKTEWHNIVLWRGLAEIAEKFLKKGDKVFIEGKISTRSYEQEGITKYITEIVANNMTMLGSPTRSGGGPQNAPLPTEEPYLASRSSAGASHQGSTSSAPSNFGGASLPEESADDLPF